MAKGGDFRALPQTGHDGVGHIAHPGLQGEKSLGDAAGPDFGNEKRRDMAGDVVADAVVGHKGVHVVGFVVFHDAHDLLGVDHGIGPADPGQGIEDVDGAAMGRAGRDHDIGHLPKPGRVAAVDLDNHLFRVLQARGGGADAGGEIDPAVGGDFRGFHHG